MDAIEVLLLWVVGCSVVVFLIVERLDSVQKERETGIGSSVLEESCRGEEEQSGADWQVVSDDSKRADFQEVAEEKENPVYDDGEEEEEEETEYSVSVSGQKSGFCCDILDISGNNVDGLYDDGGVEYEFLDDWEGVERTELDKIFGEAMVFVGSKSNADQIADLKLQLYGLQRIALQGPCHRPQPMALNVSARAKWYSS